MDAQEELALLWLFVSSVALGECRCGSEPYTDGFDCDACQALTLLRRFGKPTPPPRPAAGADRPEAGT